MLRIPILRLAGSPHLPSEVGLGRKQVSNGSKFFSAHGAYALRKLAYLPNPRLHPTSPFQQGRGAEKHLAQVQES